MKMSIDEGYKIYTLCEIDSQKEKTYSKQYRRDQRFLMWNHMKGNREQIYEFVKLHSSVNANHGISTNEIAEALGMQRTNVSTALGELLREGRVKKSSSRPVLYSLTEAFADEEGAFRELVGYDGSLKYAVQLARAALLYPHAD